MTIEELEKVPFHFVAHMSMEDMHTTTYESDDGRFGFCDHVPFKELADRTEKLKKFFHTETFNDLPTEKRALMERQYKAMAEYQDVLGERIELEGIKVE